VGACKHGIFGARQHQVLAPNPHVPTRLGVALAAMPGAYVYSFLLWSGMRFEIIWNDLKCILCEKYGFLFLKSPIHVYQYEMPVPRGSAILS
jgi:hypothetical protein